MQFRKNITKQFKQISSLPKKSNRKHTDSIDFAQDIRLINKKEEFIQKYIADCENEVNGRFQIKSSNYQQSAQKNIEGNQQKKEENWLTDQQRKIVGDIGKLFSSQASRPTKLLIRLNQTQSNKINKSGQRNTSPQNRLQKIQVTRLDSHNIQQSHLKLTNEDGFLFDKQIQNDRESQTQPHLQSSMRSIKSSIKIFPGPQSIFQPQFKFTLTKQVSIMYVPSFSHTNSPYYWSKFNKKNNQSNLGSVNSNYSQDSQKVNNIQKENLQTSNYGKLLQIQLFRRKQEIQHQRSQQLRHANQKLLSAHLFSKQQLQKAKIFIQKLQTNFKTKYQELALLLQQQKQLTKQLKNSLELKQKSLSNLNKLNEQFLKQNNELRLTIKDNIKTIKELKYQNCHKEKPINQVYFNKQGEDNKKTSFYKGQNQYGHNIMPKSPKKQTRINQQPYYNTQSNNPSSKPPTQLNYRNQITQAKLANCRSQGLLYPSQALKEQIFVLDNAHTYCEPTSRSQKNIGIKKNNFNKEPISPSTRNLVRINKNALNDGSILIGQKMKDNKSLSNFSHLSGKSASQRVGYIPKPSIQDKKSGILVDYMAQSQIKAKQQVKIQKKSQRFRFKI